jgi:predicted nucleotidyltransferase
MISSEHADLYRLPPARTREEVIETLQAHRTELDEFGVNRISLFGSVARGGLLPESDVDMIVDFAQVTYRRFVALKAFLEAILGRKVDLLTPPAVHGRLKEEIKKDLVDVPR